MISDKLRNRYHAFKIRTTADRQSNFVEMDGVRLKGVTAVEVKSEAKSISQVTLRFNTLELDVEAEDMALTETEAALGDSDHLARGEPPVANEPQD